MKKIAGILFYLIISISGIFAYFFIALLFSAAAITVIAVLSNYEFGRVLTLFFILAVIVAIDIFFRRKFVRFI